MVHGRSLTPKRSSRGWVAVAAALILAACGGDGGAGTGVGPPLPVVPTAAAAAPEGGPTPEAVPGAPVSPPRRYRLLIDAGHGAAGNSGNTSSACESEAVVMLELAVDLATRLAATGRFDLRQARTDAGPVDYGDRIAAAEAWPADLILSLHSDARAGTGGEASPAGCWQTHNAAGFSILYGEEVPAGADADLGERRRREGARLATAMVDAGFAAYPGVDYGGLYSMDAATPGLFADAHAPRKRIRMLRRPRVPSLIVETHNALDVDEVAIWRQDSTRAAFARAVAAAFAGSKP